MKILKTSKMLDGTKVQLEEGWGKFWIGTYPISKQTGSKQFEPVKGKTFLVSLCFTDLEKAEQIFRELEEGRTLLECKKYMWKPSNIKYLK